MSGGDQTIQATPATPRPNTVDKGVVPDEFTMQYDQTQLGDTQVQGGTVGVTLAVNSCPVGGSALVDETPRPKENWHTTVEATPDTEMKDKSSIGLDAPAKALTPTLQVASTPQEEVADTPLETDTLILKEDPPESVEKPAKRAKLDPTQEVTQETTPSPSVPDVPKSDSPVMRTVSKLEDIPKPSQKEVVMEPPVKDPAPGFTPGQDVYYLSNNGTQQLGAIRKVTAYNLTVSPYLRQKDALPDISVVGQISAWAATREVVLMPQTEIIELSAVASQQPLVISDSDRPHVYFRMQEITKQH